MGVDDLAITSYVIIIIMDFLSFATQGGSAKCVDGKDKGAPGFGESATAPTLIQRRSGGSSSSSSAVLSRICIGNLKRSGMNRAAHVGGEVYCAAKRIRVEEDFVSDRFGGVGNVPSHDEDGGDWNAEAGAASVSCAETLQNATLTMHPSATSVFGVASQAVARADGSGASAACDDTHLARPDVPFVDWASTSVQFDAKQMSTPFAAWLSEHNADTESYCQWKRDTGGMDALHCDGFNQAHSPFFALRGMGTGKRLFISTEAQRQNMEVIEPDCCSMEDVLAYVRMYVVSDCNDVDKVDLMADLMGSSDSEEQEADDFGGGGGVPNAGKHAPSLAAPPQPKRRLYLFSHMCAYYNARKSKVECVDAGIKSTLSHATDYGRCADLNKLAGEDREVHAMSALLALLCRFKNGELQAPMAPIVFTFRDYKTRALQLLKAWSNSAAAHAFVPKCVQYFPECGFLAVKNRLVHLMLATWRGSPIPVADIEGIANHAQSLYMNGDVRSVLQATQRCFIDLVIRHRGPSYTAAQCARAVQTTENVWLVMLEVKDLMITRAPSLLVSRSTFGMAQSTCRDQEGGAFGIGASGRGSGGNGDVVTDSYTGGQDEDDEDDVVFDVSTGQTTTMSAWGNDGDDMFMREVVPCAMAGRKQVQADGAIAYICAGQGLHRPASEGPAWVSRDGLCEEFWCMGLRHRDDGMPAVVQRCAMHPCGDGVVVYAEWWCQGVCTHTWCRPACVRHGSCRQQLSTSLGVGAFEKAEAVFLVEMRRFQPECTFACEAEDSAQVVATHRRLFTHYVFQESCMARMNCAEDVLEAFREALPGMLRIRTQSVVTSAAWEIADDDVMSSTKAVAVITPRAHAPCSRWAFAAMVRLGGLYAAAGKDKCDPASAAATTGVVDVQGVGSWLRRFHMVPLQSAVATCSSRQPQQAKLASPLKLVCIADVSNEWKETLESAWSRRDLTRFAVDSPLMSGAHDCGMDRVDIVSVMLGDASRSTLQRVQQAVASASARGDGKLGSVQRSACVKDITAVTTTPFTFAAYALWKKDTNVFPPIPRKQYRDVESTTTSSLSNDDVQRRLANSRLENDIIDRQLSGIGIGGSGGRRIDFAAVQGTAQGCVDATALRKALYMWQPSCLRCSGKTMGPPITIRKDILDAVASVSCSGSASMYQAKSMPPFDMEEFAALCDTDLPLTPQILIETAYGHLCHTQAQFVGGGATAGPSITSRSIEELKLVERMCYIADAASVWTWACDRTYTEQASIPRIAMLASVVACCSEAVHHASTVSSRHHTRTGGWSGSARGGTNQCGLFCPSTHACRDSAKENAVALAKSARKSNVALQRMNVPDVCEMLGVMKTFAAQGTKRQYDAYVDAQTLRDFAGLGIGGIPFLKS